MKIYWKMLSSSVTPDNPIKRIPNKTYGKFDYWVRDRFSRKNQITLLLTNSDKILIFFVLNSRLLNETFYSNFLILNGVLAR